MVIFIMFQDLILPMEGVSKTSTAVVFMMAVKVITWVVLVFHVSFESGFVAAYEAAIISLTAIVLLLLAVWRRHLPAPDRIEVLCNLATDTAQTQHARRRASRVRVLGNYPPDEMSDSGNDLGVVNPLTRNAHARSCGHPL